MLSPYRSPPTCAAPLLLALVLLLAAFCLLPGCATMERNRQVSALENSTHRYREALRWGYWQTAAELLHPSAQAQVDLEPLENVRISGIEVVRPAAISPEGTAFQLVQIDYVLADEQRVKRILDRQDWRWDEPRQQWLLHSGLPTF